MYKSRKAKAHNSRWSLRVLTDCDCLSTLHVAQKCSWRRQETEWLALSPLETSCLEIPSLSRPRTRPQSSVHSPNFEGTLAEALITTL